MRECQRVKRSLDFPGRATRSRLWPSSQIGETGGGAIAAEAQRCAQAAVGSPCFCWAGGSGGETLYFLLGGGDSWRRGKSPGLADSTLLCGGVIVLLSAGT